MEEEYTYERLEVLRKITRLGLKSKLKLVLLKNKIKKLETLNSNSNIEICSHHDILRLEYNLRMKKWINICEEEWIQYLKIENDGCELFEFANGNLNRMVEEQKKKIR